MTREKEMQILQSLKGDTYFNQYFSDKDIDQMCENIQNDFAIESGCKFYEQPATHLHELKKMVVDLHNDGEKKLSDLADEIIRLDVTDVALYDLLCKKFGIEFVIKAKRKHDIQLEENEIDYLISKL